VIEILSGVFATLSYLRFGLTPTALAIFVVVSALILIAFIDLDYMIIPNVINYPGAALGILIGVLSSFAPLDGIIPLDRPFVQSWLESLLGIIFGAGPLYLVWWLYLVIRQREGLGLGDIKLLIAIGALFGYECALLTIFLGSVLGSVVGVILILVKRMGFSTAIPFGPYLVTGTLVYLYDFADVITFLSGASASTIWRAFQ
jgi:leader peptidase (prepilin peptidase)/N-methyltransferase